MQTSPTIANRHALLIGIDSYPLTGHDLRGCVNDATLMRKILHECYGFPDQTLTLLTNAQATREGILKGLDELVARVQTNDIAVVFYAGHGSQIRYRARDTTKLSGWDETLVPHDSGRGPFPNRDISDDEIRRFLLRLSEKTGFISLLFDCCHSATLHRDAFGDDARSLAPIDRWEDERPLSLPSSAPTGSVTADSGTSKWLPTSDRYVVIAACREDEVATEYSIQNGESTLRHGALTYFLAQQLDKAGPKSTYREVFERAAQELTARFPAQHPHCEGAYNRVLFGAEDIETMRYVLVTETTGSSVTLDAGLPQGVLRDSEWVLYPPGTTDLSATSESLPRIKITSAGVTSAKGRLLTADLPAQLHARAVEARRPISTQWPIEIHGVPESDPAHQNDGRDPAGNLRKLLTDSPWLKLAQPGELAQARIYLLQPRESVKERDPVPQLPRISSETWAVIRRDGQMCMPALLLPQTKRLRDNLEKWVRHELLRDLDNPFSGLSDQVDFRLLTQAADESWVPAHQRPDEVCTLPDGSPFAFELTSRYHDPLFISILLIDANGAIQQLYPPPGPSGRMAPQRSGRIGIDEGHLLRFRFPRDLSFVLHPDGTEPDAVVDYLKLIITTQPMDFNVLLQEGVRAGVPAFKGSDTSLGQLLNDVLAGGPAVRSVDGYLAPHQDWATATRAVRILRPGKTAHTK